MSKLETLVPPLELCRKLGEINMLDANREGDFVCTALMWVVGEVPEFMKGCSPLYTFEIVVPADEAARLNMRIYAKTYPAPTLQEIMEVLPPYGKNEKILACCVPDWADFNARIFGEHWRVGYTGNCSINDKNPATAALKLWLKLNVSAPSESSESSVTIRNHPSKRQGDQECLE